MSFQRRLIERLKWRNPTLKEIESGGGSQTQTWTREEGMQVTDHLIWLCMPPINPQPRVCSPIADTVTESSRSDVGSMFGKTAVFRVKFRWRNHRGEIIQSTSAAVFADRAWETISR